MVCGWVGVRTKTVEVKLPWSGVPPSSELFLILVVFLSILLALIVLIVVLLLVLLVALLRILDCLTLLNLHILGVRLGHGQRGDIPILVLAGLSEADAENMEVE